MGSSHVAILCALLAAGFSRPAMGDELRPELGGDAWKMERLVTTDGKIHLGLVEAEDDEKLHFLELVRRQGQPMFAVRRPYDKEEIRSLERLSNQERQAIVDVMHSPEFVDQPPAEVFAKLLSRGVYRACTGRQSVPCTACSPSSGSRRSGETSGFRVRT